MTEDAAKTVTVNFRIALPEGSFDASADVPEGESNLTELLPVLRSLDQSLLSGVEEQLNQAGLKVSCKAGCGACCRQMVPLSIFEAEALTTWIRTLNAETQKALADRFHRALLQLSRAGLIDKLTTGNWLDNTEQARELAIEYFAAGVACPFLVEESCSIHPIRPLICREYLVTSNPQYCANPAENTDKVAPVPLPINFSGILNHMGAELEAGTPGWIPLVFLFAWMESGAQPGRAFHGTGPEVLYEFVKRAEFGRKPNEKDVKGESAQMS